MYIGVLPFEYFSTKFPQKCTSCLLARIIPGLFRSIMVLVYNNKFITVADPEGVRSNPTLSHNYFIFMQFFQKIRKNNKLSGKINELNPPL